MNDTITFQLEDYHLFKLHAQELFVEHHKEIDLFGEELDIDDHLYKRCQDAESLKVYTVREWGRLIGYCAFFLYTHTHHKTSVHAKQDVLFIKKEKRGIGLSFLKYCEAELRKEGVSEVLQCVPASNDWSKVLEYKGYKKLETIYTRKL